MKTDIPEISITQAQVGSVHVGQLALGPMEVASFVLSDTKVDMSTGGAHLHNVRLTLTLALEIDWSVQVDAGFLGHWGWSDTIDLGSHDLSIGLGDVSLPGLHDLTFDLGDVSADALSAVIGPLGDIDLGQLVAEQIAAAGVVAPVPDFSLTGLGIGKLSLDQVTVPAAEVASVSLGSVQGGRAPLGEIDLGALSFPSEHVQDVSGDALDVDAVGDAIGLHADAGVLDVTLKITPSVRLQADSFVMGAVQASASIQQAVMKGVELPFGLSDVTLGQIALNSLSIPSVGVS